MIQFFKILKEWTYTLKTPDNCSISFHQFCNELVRISAYPIAITKGLAANIKYLLNHSSDSTQTRDDVSLFDFVKLFLRFGSLKYILFRVQEISSSEFIPSLMNSQEVETVKFAQWFFPTTDHNYVMEKFGDSKFMVRLGSAPNTFTLLIKPKNGVKIENTRVSFNPLPEADPRECFAIEIIDKGVQYASSWNNLLVDILHLRVPSFAPVVLNTLQVKTAPIEAESDPRIFQEFHFDSQNWYS